MNLQTPLFINSLRVLFIEQSAVARGIKTSVNRVSYACFSQIYFKRKKTGGISFNSTMQLTHVDEKLCYQILHEYKIHNAEVLFVIEFYYMTFMTSMDCVRCLCMRT